MWQNEQRDFYIAPKPEILGVKNGEWSAPWSTCVTCRLLVTKQKLFENVKKKSDKKVWQKSVTDRRQTKKKVIPKCPPCFAGDTKNLTYPSLLEMLLFHHPFWSLWELGDLLRLFFLYLSLFSVFLYTLSHFSMSINTLMFYIELYVKFKLIYPISVLEQVIKTSTKPL